MSLECVTSLAQGYKLSANDLHHRVYGPLSARWGGVGWGWGWEAEPPTKFSKSEDLTGSKISIFRRSCWEREEVTFFSGGGRGAGLKGEWLQLFCKK